MPLAEHVGREQTFTALGGTFTLSRWTRRVWDEFLTWAKSVLPDPREAGAVFCAELLNRLGDGAADERRAVVKEALALATTYVDYSSPQVIDLLDKPTGNRQLLALLLRQHHPGLTDDDVYELHAALGINGVNALAMACAGRTPAPKDGPGETNRSPPPAATASP